MSKIGWFLVFSFLFVENTLAQLEGNKVNIVYGDRTYQIPGQFKTVVSIKGRSALLAFRYGDDKTRKYVAFSHGVGVEDFDLGCDPKVFLAAVFKRAPTSLCHPQQLEAFTEVFVKGHDVGVWHGKKDLVVYYSIGEDLSFLFLSDSKGNYTKIDTDFLDRETLKAVVEDLL